MYYVYMLQSEKEKGWLYTGYSINLQNRIKSHNNGENKATAPYAPFILVFYEAFQNKADAKRREKYLKSTKGKRALRLMLQDYFSAQNS